MCLPWVTCIELLGGFKCILPVCDLYEFLFYKLICYPFLGKFIIFWLFFCSICNKRCPKTFFFAHIFINYKSIFLFFFHRNFPIPPMSLPFENQFQDLSAKLSSRICFFCFFIPALEQPVDECIFSRCCFLPIE